MKKQLIIFGIGEIGQIAHYYFSLSSEYNVVAFTVDRAYLKEESFCGIPVLPFEEITSIFPPKEYKCFIAMSYSMLNLDRKNKYFEAKKLGYELVSYLSPHATIASNSKVGDNCFIFENNNIQPFVEIGNNVTLWSGNHIGHHSKIGDHTFIASHVVVSGGVEIGERCFIGVNATIRDHISIEDNCVIGAGSLILSSAKANGVYVGGQTLRSKASSDRVLKLL
jgi:sugar O-acyltransferase (sialic acid O-acetyltransferase NeuD family)